ncbi:DNA internalization-related competence protein ComEC/Rec2 [Sphaerotilus sp.]|uniref:DNA internalization-related competence protein ComEC/Rec2 n=1 Tax=Sphaerotilus sp. TaxID=2093942 RepID=UPI00286E4DA6|nr:DNA internalization-related competence protein ComEC/Rec2 [Sphaerotilus sp.]
MSEGAGAMGASGRGSVWAAVGSLLGTALQLQQATLAGSDGRWLAVSMALGLVVAGRAAGWTAGWRAAVWILPAVTLCAGSLTDWRAEQRLADRLDPALERQTLSVTGVVSGLPVWRPDGVRFDLEVDRPDAPAPQGVPSRLSLAWYPAGEAASFTAKTMPRAGQRWRLSVRLRLPDGLVNPHGFDTTLALFERGVGAVGTVQGAELLAETGRELVDRLRQDLRDRLRRQLGDTPAAGLLAALGVGDQAAIERGDWAVFRTTGVAHLVSISGLHVTLLGWLGGVVIGRCWRLRSGWLLVRPAPVVARWGGLAVAVCYALLAGWGVPAQRTVLMLAIVVCLRSGARRWSGARILLAAAVGVALWDPWAMLQAGFWLSFVAVGLLMLGGSPSDKAPRRDWRAHSLHELRSLWRTQWVVTVGLAPWTLLFFQQVSLVSLLANAVAIPVVTLLITPLALLGLLFAPLWGWALPVVDVLMRVLQALAAWPWASVHLPAVPWWAQALGVAAAALLVAPLPVMQRLAAMPLLLPMLWPALPVPPQGEFELLAADIGQGNAVLVRTSGHALLYDTGPAYGRHGEAGNAGERVLVPLLQALGVRSLDQLIVSHRDTDHSGGADAVLRALPVGLVQSSLEPGHPLRQRAPHQRCTAGTRWVWDGVRFEVLHPEAADHERTGIAVLRPNAVSCVLRVESASGRAALLTGDIGIDQELRLVIRQSARLKADVLLVPHHGSGSSSTLFFLKSVQPTWAIVQAGRHNRYGHPAPAVMARYDAQGIAVVRTPQCGAWHWRSADGTQECARNQRVRYWHRVEPVARAVDGPDIAKSVLNDPPHP